jgi:hypothetical protein
MTIRDPKTTRETVHWPDAVDEIFASDQAVMFAHVTPARGAVLTPLTNFGLRDREAGRMTPLSSSLGMWKKLERIQRNPQVAVAYHSREHSFTARPEYVLVQGRASFSSLADRGEWVEEHRQSWERFIGPRDVGFWERWTRIYHWRVGIEIEVERVVVWPDLDCRGELELHGVPFPSESPTSQRPPAKGTGPRLNHKRAARRAKRRPHVLLGWVGADGFPVVVPVRISGTEKEGISLEASSGVTIPPGGRRAGLTAHSFGHYTFGQHKHQYTGWIDADRARRGVYAPHTESGYWLPESEFLYRIGSGFVTRRGFLGGRRAGFLPG